MKYSLSFKILGGFLAVLFLFAAGSAFSIIQVRNIGANIDNISYEIVRTDQLRQVQFNARGQIAAVRAYLINKDENMRELFDRDAAANEMLAAEIIETAQDEVNEEKYLKIKVLNEQITKQGRIIFELAGSGKMDEALALAGQEGFLNRNELAVLINELVEDRRENLYTISSDTQNRYDNVQKTMITVGVISFLLGIGIAFLLMRIITRPLGKIVNGVQLISGGDLTGKPIKVSGNDELSIMANAFNNMKDSLCELVGKIGAQSSKVAGISEQLSHNARQVTHGFNETTSTVLNITEATNHIENNIRRVSSDAGETNRIAAGGGELINRLENQIKAMASTTTAVKEAVEKLSGTAGEITKMTGIITQIADQTNLLALNAAIESARAGDAGRGFAVVAEEVRKLAEESGRAAMDINQLISRNQSEIESAIEAITAGSGEAETGLAVVGEVGVALKDILEKVCYVTEGVQQVSTAVEQISEGMQNVTATVEEQNAVNEEMNSLSEMLTASAADLRKLMNLFQVESIESSDTRQQAHCKNIHR